MAKRALQLASVASMIDQFNIPNIKLLQSLGYQVDVAADFTNPGTITKERADNLKMRLSEMNVRVFDVAIPRSLNPVKIYSAYKKIKNLINEESYNLLHCHSPIGGVIARQAAKKSRKNGLKVIYTAHGFHFFDGAPIKNWMIFYPIEKYYSKYTDVLITINKEDFNRANNKFHAKKTIYIPGVGIDTAKFSVCNIDRNEKRLELGLSTDDFVIISVGELNDNKNHIVIIRALMHLPENFKYILVGKGDLSDQLKDAVVNLGLSNRVIFTGYRTDICDLLYTADCFAFPSKREGLGLAALEGMAAGLPVIGHDIGGIRDFVIEDKTGYLCKSDEDYVKAIKKCAENIHINHYICNQKAKEFDVSITNNIMREVYTKYV